MSAASMDLMDAATGTVLDPWEEQPPDRLVIPADELVDLTPTALAEAITRLGAEIERMGRVLAVRIRKASEARRVYRRQYDEALLNLRLERRSSADVRRALVHREIGHALADDVELAEGLVESARGYLGALEKDLTAKQSALRTMTAVDATFPHGLMGAQP